MGSPTRWRPHHTQPTRARWSRERVLSSQGSNAREGNVGERGTGAVKTHGRRSPQCVAARGDTRAAARFAAVITGSGSPGHLLVRLGECPPEADLSVVDPDVEPAIGIVAHPRLEDDRRTIAAVVTERKHGSLVALPARRQLLYIHPI